MVNGRCAAAPAVVGAIRRGTTRGSIFGAWGSPRFFSGGGRVIGTDSERAARARLRFADGMTLEDSVEAGVVLFISEAPVRLPATIEIFDGTGTRLTMYDAFKRL